MYKTWTRIFNIPLCISWLSKIYKCIIQNLVQLSSDRKFKIVVTYTRQRGKIILMQIQGIHAWYEWPITIKDPGFFSLIASTSSALWLPLQDPRWLSQLQPSLLAYIPASKKEEREESMLLLFKDTFWKVPYNIHLYLTGQNSYCDYIQLQGRPRNMLFILGGHVLK